MHRKKFRNVADAGAFTIDAFCAAHGISRAFYFKLQKAGQGPDVLAVGRRRLITADSAARWRKRFEAPHG